MKPSSLKHQLLTLAVAVPLGHALATDPVEQQALKTDGPLTISVGSKAVTTLQFPRAVNGIFGYGLTTGAEPGTYHYAHPEGSRVLALRNLLPGKETFLTVLLGREDLYVLHLKPSADPPVLVRLSEPSSHHAQARPIDPETVEERKLDHDTARLFNLLKLGKNERTFRIAVPHLYQDVESRDVEHRWDDDKVATVITRVHRFPQEDAIFLNARIENQTAKPLYFDPGSLQVKVGSRTYPTALVDASSEIPAKGNVNVHAIIRGGIEGERAHLSIKNEFQLVMAEYTDSPDTLALREALGTILEPLPEGPDASLFRDPIPVKKGGSK